MNQLRFFCINAFTRMSGNAATICLVNQFPNDAVMGYAAKKLGTPMTIG